MYGLTPNEIPGAVVMGKAGWLNEEGFELVVECQIGQGLMKGVSCVVGLA